MDDRRFDAMTRAWASKTARRGVLAGLLGIALAGATGRLGATPGPTPAATPAPMAPYPYDGGCQTSSMQQYEERCGYSTCQNGFCVRSAAGAWRCVEAKQGKAFGGDLGCPLLDECAADADCGEDGVCAVLGGCCPGRRATRCARARTFQPVSPPPLPPPPAERPAVQRAADLECAADPAPDYEEECVLRLCGGGAGVCVARVEGGWRCVASVSRFNSQSGGCAYEGSCFGDGDCAGGFTCVQLGGCCPDRAGFSCLAKAIDRPPRRPRPTLDQARSAATPLAGP